MVNYLHAGLSAAVIKDGVSDTMIVQEEEVRDNNPWENMNHNDRLWRRCQWLRPLSEGGWNRDVRKNGRKTATSTGLQYF